MSWFGIPAEAPVPAWVRMDCNTGLDSRDVVDDVEVDVPDDEANAGPVSRPAAAAAILDTALADAWPVDVAAPGAGPLIAAPPVVAVCRCGWAGCEALSTLT